MRHYIKNHPVYFVEFDHKKNSIKALHYSDASSLKIHWICKNGHEWFSSPLNRNKGLSCPFCPKELKTKNLENSLKSIRHICDNGHEWIEPISLFNKRKTCVRCECNIFDALTFINQQYPDIAIEGMPLIKGHEWEYSNTFKFFEDEICHKWPIVKSILDNYKDKTVKINSAKLKTCFLSMDDAFLFEKENSLSSTARYSYSIGLQKDNIVYQILRYLPQKDGTVKILALSTKNGYNVAGGYSRLLRELDKKILQSGYKINKFQISINMRFNSNEYWSNAGFVVKKCTSRFCLSDGFVRSSLKSELKNSFKISDYDHLLLEKEI